MSEKSHSPQQPEILFFDESIVAKKNRSVTLMKKSKVTYLYDKSKEISETYLSITPNDYGISRIHSSLSPSSMPSFNYASFPALNVCNYGPIRPCKSLLKGPETLRYSKSSNTAIDHIFQQRIESGVNANDSTLQQTRSDTLLEVKHKNRQLELCIRRIQAAYQRHKYSCRSHSLSMTSRRGKAVICIQKYVRRYLCRCQYDRCIRSVIYLQSLCRMMVCMKALRTLKRCVRRVYAHARGYCYRRKMKLELLTRIRLSKLIVLASWVATCESIYYRYLYWELLHEMESKSLLLTQAMLVKEVNRLSGISASSIRIRGDALVDDRKDFYTVLKLSDDSNCKDDIYRMYGLTNKKLKKQTLSKLLWSVAAIASADAYTATMFRLRSALTMRLSECRSSVSVDISAIIRVANYDVARGLLCSLSMPGKKQRQCK